MIHNEKIQNIFSGICLLAYVLCSRVPLSDGPTFHLRMETDWVSETVCSLEYQTMDKLQKPGSFKCNLLSSEAFRTDDVEVEKASLNNPKQSQHSAHR
jgi:hypothetical protein